MVLHRSVFFASLLKKYPTPIPTPTPTPSVEISVQELARNPAAFRAKEKRLVRVLKDLDSKLERLNKDRDAALRK